MTDSVLDHPRWAKLPSKRQEELLGEYRGVNVDHDWWDFLFEDFTNRCAAQGIGVSAGDIHFSGFCSQGDGACFEGYVNDWAKILDAIKRPELLDLAEEHCWRYNVYSRGRYSHSGTMSGELNAELPENPYDEEEDPLRFTAWNLANPMTQCDLDELESDLLAHFRGLADDLYSDLEQEYDYFTDDEQVVDWILDNLDDDELRDPDEDLDEEPEQEDEGGQETDTRQLELF